MKKIVLVLYSLLAIQTVLGACSPSNNDEKPVQVEEFRKLKTAIRALKKQLDKNDKWWKNAWETQQSLNEFKKTYQHDCEDPKRGPKNQDLWNKWNERLNNCVDQDPLIKILFRLHYTQEGFMEGLSQIEQRKK